MLDRRVRRLQLGCPDGDFAQLVRALNAGPHQNDVFEDNPARVFQPTPICRQHAVHRLRPVDAPKIVVGGDDHGGGDENAPIAIERQKRQGAEYVKMRFDPAARQMDQDSRSEHLGNGNRVTRDCLAWPIDRERNWKAVDDSRQEDRCPQMGMHVAVGDDPGLGRNPDRRRNSSHPLEDQQDREHSIRTDENALLVLVE